MSTTRTLYTDARVTITETTSENPGPDDPGGWRSIQYQWAAGTPQANRDAIDAQLAQAVAFFSGAYKNWATLTVGQKDIANRNAMRALANLLRQVRGDFSAAD